MKTNKCIVFILSAVLLLALLIPVHSYGFYIDLTHKPSLEVLYQDGNLPIANAYFEIHLIQEYDASGKLTVTEQFEKYNVGLDGKSGDLKKIARTLAGYVLLDSITPYAEGRTDENGRWKQADLTHGMYLVIGDKHEQGGYTYTAEPFIVSLPADNHLGGAPIYHAVVCPKAEKGSIEEPPTQPDYVKRKVLKAWNDEGFEHIRPESIEIVLLKNGEVFDTVSLTAQNNWRYTWENLDSRYDYVIVERILSDYVVTVERFGATFLVTNTYENMPTPTPTPDATKTPMPTQTPSVTSPTASQTPSVTSPTASQTPSVTSPTASQTPSVTSPTASQTPSVTSPTASQTPSVTQTPPVTAMPTPTPPPKLPQTGQLWWPIPLLLCAGFFLTAAGMILRRKND